MNRKAKQSAGARGLSRRTSPIGRTKYRVMICDDSERERQRFYSRQFKNFDILGVVRKGHQFVETNPMDSVDKFYQRISELGKAKNLPDLVLLDLFYKKPLAG